MTHLAYAFNQSHLEVGIPKSLIEQVTLMQVEIYLTRCCSGHGQSVCALTGAD